MKTNIGIKSEPMSEVAHALNQLLADEHVLYIKTRNAHWNVEGPDFYTKHKFFEDQYTELEGIIDEVAERIRYLGHYAAGSMEQFLKLTHLSEHSRPMNNSEEYIKELLQDHETIIMHAREHIGQFADEWHDEGSSDFITGLMRSHEKMAWMLRAHLK